MDADLAHLQTAPGWPATRDRLLFIAIPICLITASWGYDTVYLPKVTALRLLALAMLLIGLFTVSRSAWASSNEAKISRIHPLRLPILIRLMGLAAVALRSPDRLDSLPAVADEAVLALFFFSFCGAASSARFQRVLAWVISSTAIVCAAWAVAQRLAGHARPVGPFTDPAELSAYLCIAFLVVIQASPGEDHGGPKHSFWIWMAAMGTVSAGIGVAWDCWPAIVTGLGVFAIARPSTERDGWGRFLRWLGLPSMVLGSVATALFAMRLNPWRSAALAGFRARPGYGWGPGAFNALAHRFTTSPAVALVHPNYPPAGSTSGVLDAVVSGGLVDIGLLIWIVVAASAIAVRRIRNNDPVDSPLAAGWLAALATALCCLFLGSPGVATSFMIWTLVAMASTPSACSEGQPNLQKWPVWTRAVGVVAALPLLVPIPASSLGVTLAGPSGHGRLEQMTVLTGTAGAIRWQVSDAYFAAAERHQQASDWDRALQGYIQALNWAPTRFGNWLGFGDGCTNALRAGATHPAQWLQYGQLVYYRARQLQPWNRLAYYGEARLMAAGAARGLPVSCRDAHVDLEVVRDLPLHRRDRLELSRSIDAACRANSASLPETHAQSTRSDSRRVE